MSPLTAHLRSLAACLLLAVMACGNSHTSASDVRWHVSPEVSLGDLQAGESMRVDCRVSNLGSTPLQIKRVASSCGCVASLAQRITIPPTSDGVLTLVVTAPTRNREPEFSARVLILTADPTCPLLAVRLAGTITTPCGLWPTGFNIGICDPGEEVRVSLRDTGSPETEPAVVECEILGGPHVHLTAKAGHEYDLVFAAPKQAGRFELRGRLTVRRQIGVSECTFSVLGAVRPDITVFPSRVLCSELRQGVRVKLRCTDRLGDILHVSVPESASPLHCEDMTVTPNIRLVDLQGDRTAGSTITLECACAYGILRAELHVDVGAADVRSDKSE